jgi:hypothetical protein
VDATACMAIRVAAGKQGVEPRLSALEANQHASAQSFPVSWSAGTRTPIGRATTGCLAIRRRTKGGGLARAPRVSEEARCVVPPRCPLVLRRGQPPSDRALRSGRCYRFRHRLGVIPTEDSPSPTGVSTSARRALVPRAGSCLMQERPRRAPCRRPQSRGSRRGRCRHRPRSRFACR